MQKLLFVFIILVQGGLLSAQERDNVGHKVGSWNISSHNCFKGLGWKIRKSYYSDNSDKYTNEIEIKNNYGSTITFSYNMSENSNETTTRYRRTLTSGQTYTSTYCPNVNFVTFYVTEVCFNSNNRCDNTCYALCDNGSPNIPNDCGGNKTSSSSIYKSNNTNTQTNDLSEYNRSKADLERQLQDENQKIAISNEQIRQRQIQQEAQQRELKRQQDAKRTEALVNVGIETTKYVFNEIKSIREDNKIREEKEFLKSLEEAKKKEEYSKINTINDLNQFFAIIDLTYRLIIEPENKLPIDKIEFNLHNYPNESNVESNVCEITIGSKKFNIFQTYDKFNGMNFRVQYPKSWKFKVERRYDRNFKRSSILKMKNCYSINFHQFITSDHLYESYYKTSYKDDIYKGAKNYFNEQKKQNLESVDNPKEELNSIKVSNNFKLVLDEAILEMNKGTHDGAKNAINLLEPYAEIMNGDNLSILGYCFEKIKDYLPAMKYYKMAGEKGSDWGNYAVARFYINGWGEQNDLLAMEYLSRVSTKFSEINAVNYQIAYRFDNGTGVTKNSNKAFNYYSKINSDYHNIAEVYHRLGHLCAIGANNNEGTIDYTLTANFYNKGANLNNTECMRHLGDFYNIGGKLEENLTLSKKWYKKACDLKNEKACISLNKME